MRFGPGKLKHVAGRILWIQQAVAEGSVQLAQVGTIWNLSDLGTEPLRGNRLRLLLPEINMSSESGTCAIGEEEYQLQVRKHGSVKHVGLLAKQVARVILQSLERKRKQSFDPQKGLANPCHSTCHEQARRCNHISFCACHSCHEPHEHNPQIFALLFKVPVASARHFAKISQLVIIEYMSSTYLRYAAASASRSSFRARRYKR